MASLSLSLSLSLPPYIYLSIYKYTYIYIHIVYIYIYHGCIQSTSVNGREYLFPKNRVCTKCVGQGIPAHCTYTGFLGLAFSISNFMYDASNTCNTHLICVLASGDLVLAHSLPENLWISGTSARTKSSPQTAPLVATRVFNNTKPAMILAQARIWEEKLQQFGHQNWWRKDLKDTSYFFPHSEGFFVHLGKQPAF